MDIDTLLNSAIVYQQFETTSSDGYFMSAYDGFYPSYTIPIASNKKFDYKTQLTVSVKFGYKPNENTHWFLLSEGSIVSSTFNTVCYISDSNNINSDSFTFFGQTVSSSFFILNNIYTAVITYDHVNKNGYYSIHNQTNDTWLFGVLTTSYSFSTKKDSQIQIGMTNFSDASCNGRIYSIGFWNQMLTSKDHINIIKQMEI